MSNIILVRNNIVDIDYVAAIKEVEEIGHYTGNHYIVDGYRFDIIFIGNQTLEIECSVSEKFEYQDFENLNDRDCLEKNCKLAVEKLRNQVLKTWMDYRNQSKIISLDIK
jgi:hypothetical protein